jgi:hypothetical protein
LEATNVWGLLKPKGALINSRIRQKLNKSHEKKVTYLDGFESRED